MTMARGLQIKRGRSFGVVPVRQGRSHAIFLPIPPAYCSLDCAPRYRYFSCPKPLTPMCQARTSKGNLAHRFPLIDTATPPPVPPPSPLSATVCGHEPVGGFCKSDIALYTGVGVASFFLGGRGGGDVFTLSLTLTLKHPNALRPI